MQIKAMCICNGLPDSWLPEPTPPLPLPETYPFVIFVVSVLYECACLQAVLCAAPSPLSFTQSLQRRPMFMQSMSKSHKPMRGNKLALSIELG